ncbi:hypothetical protein DES30_1011992, partial [Prauserella marina]
SDLTLTANYTTPVAQRYAADTALRTTLGAPQGPEGTQSGLHYQGYANGGAPNGRDGNIGGARVDLPSVPNARRSR